MKIALRSFVLALALSAGAAWAAQPSQAQLDRLTDLVVTAMPFGQVFDMMQVKDSKWPLGDKADKATPDQLACLRGELSAAGYRRVKRKDVEAYAAAHPERVADDIRLLESGAAELFGKFVLAGAEGEAITALASDAAHADLRILIGMGNMFDRLAEGNDEAMRAEGEKQGTQVGVQLMIGAMETCQLPMSALQ